MSAPVQSTAITGRHTTARRLEFEGWVQGVGFRPYVHRLAHELGLSGRVFNTGQGVTVLIEGSEAQMLTFSRRVTDRPPVSCRIDKLRSTAIEPDEPFGSTFSIADTVPDTAFDAVDQTPALPDLAPCSLCLADLADNRQRRFRYPFISCAQCGPRYSILYAGTFDRRNTSMRDFSLCARCQQEYQDPTNRRFHAQTIACPDCGPALVLHDQHGTPIATRDDALSVAVDTLRNGLIVALKGLGGYQLVVDACNEEAVAKLRRRKHRPVKPLAVMMPSLPVLQGYCRMTVQDAALLSSSAAPIVLLDKIFDRSDSANAMAASIAPGISVLGVMLPSTPLHSLIAQDMGSPLVVTSGNRSGEPIVFDDSAALTELTDIADLFLVHDRSIVSPLDDSVVRTVADRPMMLRRARGYASRPIPLTSHLPATLALGGHQRATAAAVVGDRAFMTPYVGDLDTLSARTRFADRVQQLMTQHRLPRKRLACDCHPDYHSTRMALDFDGAATPVQHHVAHIVSCMADNRIEGPVLGAAWDGSGVGLDGTLWGGEFIRIAGGEAHRLAHLKPFSLPGGERAVEAPCRAALGLVHALHEASIASLERQAQQQLRVLEPFETDKRPALLSMLERNVASPVTSSVGRLFDAVASLCGLVHHSTFTGEAAMALESVCDPTQDIPPYPMTLTPMFNDGRPGWIIDWHPMIERLLDDLDAGRSVGAVATAFHHWLVDAVVAVATRVGEARVVMSGGCFQNRYLAETLIHRLRTGGFDPYWHHDVPPNDGGLALGQAVWAASQTVRVV